MKRLNVLLVTYSFPPAGGIGVIRASSLARYLPSEGIRLDVLTARNASSVGTDPSLLKAIPGEVTIHRTFTLDLPFGIKKRLKRLVAGARPPASQERGHGTGRRTQLPQKASVGTFFSLTRRSRGSRSSRAPRAASSRSGTSTLSLSRCRLSPAFCLWRDCGRSSPGWRL